MVKRAALVWVNGGITICDTTIYDYNDPEEFSYSAVLRIFTITKKARIMGSVMYLDSPPNFQECAAMADAKLSKVVYRGMGEGRDFTAGQQLLAEAKVEVEQNDKLIMYGDELEK